MGYEETAAQKIHSHLHSHSPQRNESTYSPGSSSSGTCTLSTRIQSPKLGLNDCVDGSAAPGTGVYPLRRLGAPEGRPCRVGSGNCVPGLGPLGYASAPWPTFGMGFRVWYGHSKYTHSHTYHKLNEGASIWHLSPNTLHSPTCSLEGRSRWRCGWHCMHFAAAEQGPPRTSLASPQP